jgi:hypothetical protein
VQSSQVPYAGSVKSAAQNFVEQVDGSSVGSHVLASQAPVATVHV